MSQRHLLALFNDFDGAAAAISELRATSIKGFDIDDLILPPKPQNPIIWVIQKSYVYK